MKRSSGDEIVLLQQLAEKEDRSPNVGGCAVVGATRVGRLCADGRRGWTSAVGAFFISGKEDLVQQGQRLATHRLLVCWRACHKIGGI